MAFGFLSVSVPWVDISAQLHVTAAKFSFRKPRLNTLHHSSLSLFFLHFNRGNTFEESYIKVPESPQDYKVPYQRAKMLQNSQKSPNKTQRSMSCTACSETISSKEARSALRPLLISLSSVHTSHPMSVYQRDIL